VAPFAPNDPPPILLAAIGQRMVEVALEEADGWLLHPIHTTDDTIERWHTAPVAEVRSTRPFQIVSYRLVWHEDWPESLRDGLRANLAFYGLTRSYKSHRERLPLSWGDAIKVRQHLNEHDYARAGAYVDDELFEQVVLCGSTERIAAAIRAEAPFVDRLCLTLPWMGYLPHDYALAVGLVTELIADLRPALDARADRVSTVAP
jgi:alkanesulfonate monooxygenase SsuD/methylene tetrahydromethanopterin reductase-like flavin-dependent oxidoreductase (luciferase family)